MENEKMKRMMMIKNKISTLPKGDKSPSGKYWCVTCKKFFVLDKPECPYMTGMCINTPIAVENLNPESTESLEKFGLFYPKIPQKILNFVVTDNFTELGILFAKTYLAFLKEWKFKQIYTQPLQTVKSFIILLTGSETAQRINNTNITFVVMDVEKVWQKEKITKILLSAFDYLKTELQIKHNVKLDFIEIFGEREIGKYYCAKCGMFFEFGIKREKVTCPLMSQKCMFDPQHIEKVTYETENLTKQFKITPDIYKKLISCVAEKQDFSQYLDTLLKEWKIYDKEKQIYKLLTQD